MDDLKSSPFRLMNNWHFIDYIYNPQNIFVNNTIPPENIVWAIDQARSTLKSTTSAWSASFGLRILLHLLGDLHQPLHCESAYFDNSVGNGTMTKGDMGGNLWILGGPSAPPEFQNLHSFWDSIAGLFPANYSFTISDIENWGDILMQQYPSSFFRQFVPGEIDAEKWSRESYQIAATLAYIGFGGIQFSQYPSESYTNGVRNLLSQQVALAGYRLGVVLNEVASSPTLPQYTPCTGHSKSVLLRTEDK